MKGVILGVCLLAAWLATSIAAAETWVADEWRTEVVERGEDRGQRAEGAECFCRLSTVGCPLPEKDCCLRLLIVRPPAAGVAYVWAVRAVPRYLRPFWRRGPVRRLLSFPFIR